MSAGQFSLPSQTFGGRPARRIQVARARRDEVAAVVPVTGPQVSFWQRLSDQLMRSRIDWATGGRGLDAPH
jgi:hypothetical protein